ncbi:alpha amylase N-terminal ig-like domain-containing protein [Elusimicrobiota bacterium]
MSRIVISILLTACVAAPARAGVKVSHIEGDRYAASFTYSPQIAVESVSLAGSMNEWKKDKLVLEDPDGDGVYGLTVPLTKGRYTYKFVLNGEIWKPDPENDRNEPDGFTGFNSVLVVGDLDSSPAVKARLGDGEIVAESLLHRRTIEFSEWVPRDGTAVLRLRTAHDDVEAVRLVTNDERAPRRLERVYAKDGHDYWELAFHPPSAAFGYFFELIDGDKRAFLGPDGLSDARPEWNVFDKDKAPRLDVPSWVEDAVFYQIFPERFANGDPDNDPPGSKPWGSEPELFNFMGGDLQGVLDKLPYLRELGVNAIYFNPIFEAPSNHKYDTADYLKIDPHFGDEALFRKLTEEAGKRGIRVILDGVFNHSGDKFWAFSDIIDKQRDSKYLDWYTVNSFPVTPSTPTYECWWGFGHLPKLNTTNPDTRKYLMKVAAEWIERGAAGWRLDVPNEVPHEFWVEFRRRVREADPEAYIVGEIWTDALKWLGGDQFDAVMNYVFRSAVLGYFATEQIGLEDFHRQLLEQRHRYPRGALASQFNLLGSHDTERVGTVFKGDMSRLKLAVLFQMTYLGAPVIYYGDEVGLPGGKDPDCRRAFPWDERDQDRELFEHYRKLIRIRKATPELRWGDFEAVLTDAGKNVYAFLREYGEEKTLVILHRGADTVEVRLSVPEGPRRGGWFRDLYSGSSYPLRHTELKLSLGPYQGMILKLEH